MFITGADLRKLRLTAGKTTTEMARFAGVKTRKTYENWEKQMSSPSFNQVVLLIQGCGFEAAKVVGDLVSREDDNRTLDSYE